MWLSLVPLGVASWVALSRTMDYRRTFYTMLLSPVLISVSMIDHWHDVLAGSALGLGIAYFSYRQYYPHLASKTAHIPFITRFEEAEYNIDDGTVVFRDGDADNSEEVGLIGGSRKPQGDGRA